MSKVLDKQSNQKKIERWQIWADKPEAEGTLVQRAQAKLPEMESTKQLVKLVSGYYKPGMRVLDAGCNVGHYLRGLRRLDPKLNYTGIDAYESYISKAKEIYKDDPLAHFAVKDIFQPLFPEKPFDIVYSCNVLVHLPDFRPPVKNLLESTKKVCFIRTLFEDFTTIVRKTIDSDLDEKGEPINFAFQNTWSKKLFSKYVESLGWKVEFIEDEFNLGILEKEYTTLKKGLGTRILGGKQVDGNIIFNWMWAKITKA